jgi:hypothetical protein
VCTNVLLCSHNHMFATGRAQVTWSMITKNFVGDIGALRRLFFCSATPEVELQRLAPLFKQFEPACKLIDLTTLRVRTCLLYSCVWAVRPYVPPNLWCWLDTDVHRLIHNLIHRLCRKKSCLCQS